MGVVFCVLIFISFIISLLKYLPLLFDAEMRKQKAEKKAVYIADCVRALNESYLGTRELMNYGTNTYLEVLTAQEDLLSTQITEVQNLNDGIQALINLYTALGGF